MSKTKAGSSSGSNIFSQVNSDIDKYCSELFGMEVKGDNYLFSDLSHMRSDFALSFYIMIMNFMNIKFNDIDTSMYYSVEINVEEALKKGGMKETIYITATLKSNPSGNAVKIFGIGTDKIGNQFAFRSKDSAHLFEKILQEIDALNNNELIIKEFPEQYPNETAQLYKRLPGQKEFCRIVKGLLFLSAKNYLIGEHPGKFVKLTSDALTAYANSVTRDDDITDLNENSTLYDITKKLLNNNRGVVIGNSHIDFNTPEYLTNNIKHFNGVNVLFIEYPVSVKDNFDAFNIDGDIKKLSEALEKQSIYVSEWANIYPVMEKLFLAAFNAKVKVIPVDDFNSMKRGNAIEERNRYSDNIMAYNIADYMSNNNVGKFLFVVGAAHSMIAQKLRVPMVVVLEKRLAGERGIKYGFEPSTYNINNEGCIIPFYSTVSILPPNDVRDEFAIPACQKTSVAPEQVEAVTDQNHINDLKSKLEKVTFSEDINKTENYLSLYLQRKQHTCQNIK